MTTNCRTVVLIVAGLIALLPLDQILEARATENTQSVAGLYIGKDLAPTSGGQNRYNIMGHHFIEAYLYLSPDGTFYQGSPPSGYDQLDANSGVTTGRYSVQAEEVILHYTDGDKRTIPRDGNSLNYGGVGVAQRLPLCDGLKLSGTYQLSGFSMTISFTPDGKFVDHGAMPQILNLTDSRIDSSARTLRPGPGTYTVKNHTLTLRYEHGPVFKLFFYVGGNGHGDIDPQVVRIRTALLSYDLVLQEQAATPPSRLLKIESPAGWKSRYLSAGKSTEFAPLNIPKGRSVLVLARDPEPLDDRNASRFPLRVHDAVAQEIAKRYASEGKQIVKPMTRQQSSVVPFSTAIMTMEGKTFWITVFTLLSSTQIQAIVMAAEGEDLYNAYLPTVRAMLGDGDSSLLVRQTSLPSGSEASAKIKMPPGWTSQYDSENKATKLFPPSVPRGRIFVMQISDPDKITSSSSDFHDEVVQGITNTIAEKKGRLESVRKQDDREQGMLSHLVFILENGKRVWVTMITLAAGTEGRGGMLMTDGEDLQKEHLPTLRTVIADMTSR